MTEAPRIVPGDAQHVHAAPVLNKNIWKGGAERLRVLNVVDEAPDVKTFTFLPETAALFDYRAGQFLTLDLPAPSGPLLRTYTISSTPSRPMSLSVTVKAQAASVGTRWMFENLVPGSFVRAVGPAGNFTLDLAKRSNLLFVSAGSGITPMMSMLRWLADVSPDTDVGFLHCARSPADIIFKEELVFLARLMPNLRLGFLVEERDRANAWSGMVGRLDLVKLRALFPDFAGREAYCCGPDPFMKWVRNLVLSNGLPEANYHEEAFTFPAMPVVETNEAKITLQPEVRPHVAINLVRFRVSEKEHPGSPEETLLQTARKAGVSILSVCEMGLCGTCKVMKVSGDVTMEHNGGITDDEIEQGYILACCSRPTSPVEIEV
ncbi:hybrid-cluster NAD(P)-dependent oxidoreductase [Mesorhizobium sp. CA8]|uniref:hybrid-cluster NAD(P)-dependent oxidoreductase n=1 Tax=unclassified Mesorhizobium TaxID=325217 RepID=UPI001CCB28F7|nr:MULTISPECIES: hybrid-cluster NAD(P)-dependent oxidoreductase [unclassified Mesorhizobium]MBZ9761807.1 hybrid-cluster NAD(P)-dependent oxidoreductase [Mesorhizobium sp. CA8]MBZ9823568.1 hybrid-cluster NAD(P)-dependent oxidoreductase [Mesorhizobium sp. CA4]